MSMGAHVAARKPAPAPRLFLILVMVISLVSTSFGVSDIESLLKFKDALAEKSALGDWNPSTNPCSWNLANWNGVLCLNGTIWGLKLEHMGLKGLIDVDALGLLQSIRTISLMNNKFEGPFPEIKKLDSLKSLYLSNNYFSGKIPDDAFAGMEVLKKVYIANNKLTGNIPSSLVALPRLLELRLEANQFQGNIPDFKQDGLKIVNLANNQLEGPIPASLNKMDSSSFTGNKNLCGPPLDPCEVSAQNVNQEGQESKRKVSLLKVVIIVIVVAILIGIIAAAIIIYRRRKKTSQIHRASSLEGSDKLQNSHGNQTERKMPETVEPKKKADYGKLSFLRDDTERFDLQDLLRSSAEVLGSGTFGASYKTAISSGKALVVKRYKQMNNVGREDFHEHMRRLGRLSHPNLLPLTAFYYRREEKLLVFEFKENGSLASKLHANHTADRPGLDWYTRLKIVKGVLKGLAYLHNELHSPVLPHGHLKSSNVLLDKSFEPLLTDYALRPVINTECAHTLMVAYKSPEFSKKTRISRKADVWSLGILILELLTGKFPENYLLQRYDRNASLSTWVNNMVKEKRLSEVFDKEMKEGKHSKSEMINLLKIGLGCCEEDVEARMDLKEVTEKIEQLKEETSDDQDHAIEGSGIGANFTKDESSFSM